MSRSNIVSKKDFLGKPAPPGYVAGVGRGACGFTTRSDLGPAREATRPSGSGYGGAGHSSKSHGRDNDDDEESEYLNEANYDEFAGYKGSIFNKEDPYDKGDEEADKVWESIDSHMGERGMTRIRKQALQLEDSKSKRTKIQHQFSDLIEDLKKVSEADWVNLPEVGDARNRKQRIGKIDKYTPIPESLLAEQNRIAKGGETLVSIDPRTANHPDVEMKNDDEDDQNPTQKISKELIDTNKLQLVNIDDMNKCREDIIKSTLINATKIVGSAQSREVDRDAYLSQLNSANQVKVDDNIEERRRQCQMMVKQSDLSLKEKGYIMYIDLEEKAGKLSTAISLAVEACKKCPTSVDLWLQNIKLNRRDKARLIMIDAISANMTSLKLWLKAAELETLQGDKLKVFEKACRIIPDEPEIWRRWAETETKIYERDIILEKAVDKCPKTIDLWISLARIKTNLNSGSEVLTRANNQNPTDKLLRIELAKLHEKFKESLSVVKEIISDVIDNFKNRGVDINRQEWFNDAIFAEHEGFPMTATAIVSRLLCWDLGHLERDQKKLLEYLLEDANKFANQNSPACVRAIYRCIVDSFRGSNATSKTNLQLREMIWLSWAKFEQNLAETQNNGNSEKLEEVLEEATSRPEFCQSSDTLWCMLIDLKLKSTDQSDKSSSPSDILRKALEKNPCSEKLNLAAVEFYCSKGSTKDARRILADACMANETASLVMRHAELERSLGNQDEAVRLLKVGISKYKDNPKFFLSLGQIEEERGKFKGAEEHYIEGLKTFKTNIELWISLAKLREKTGSVPRARSTLEKARIFNDKVAPLYVESAKLEIRHFLSSVKGSLAINKRPNLAESLISEGIRKCRGQPETSQLETMQKLIKERKFNQCL